MNACPDRREALLTADPAQLRTEGEGPLAEHLRECRGCREDAARIVAANAALEAWLSPPTDVPDVEEVLRRAAGSAPRRAASAGTPSVRRALGWSGGMVAAAAAVLLWSGRGGESPVDPLAPVQVEAPPLIQETSARAVAVLPTDNPDITVLWFF